MGSLIYLIGAVAIFIGTIAYCVVKPQSNDEATEIVGLAFILATTWPLAAVAAVVWLSAMIVFGPFWLLTNLLLRRRT